MGRKTPDLLSPVELVSDQFSLNDNSALAWSAPWDASTAITYSPRAIDPTGTSISKPEGTGLSGRVASAAPRLLSRCADTVASAAAGPNTPNRRNSRSLRSNCRPAYGTGSASPWSVRNSSGVRARNAAGVLVDRGRP